jgi:putative FmdB family regulatory protein
MPMYEYACPECGARFEKLRRMSEADSPSRCTVCGAENAQRVISTFCAAGGCGPGGNGRFT